ncbi:putative exocyst complex component, partial [Operophtera brumata]
MCWLQCVRALEEWLDGVKNDGAAGAVDGTVHQLAAAALAHCHALAAHMHTIGNGPHTTHHRISSNIALRCAGPALAAEPSYARAVGQLSGAHDRDAVMLAVYMRNWNKIIAHLVLDETLPAKLRDKDRQMLKDKFARGFSVPDAELREALKRDNKQAILPRYSAFHE